MTPQSSAPMTLRRGRHARAFSEDHDKSPQIVEEFAVPRRVEVDFLASLNPYSASLSELAWQRGSPQKNLAGCWRAVVLPDEVSVPRPIDIYVDRLTHDRPPAHRLPQVGPRD